MRFNEWLRRVDQKAEARGHKTLWQFTKFLVVSLLTTGVQLLLVNLLYFFLKGWVDPLPGLLGQIFNEAALGEGHASWGYLLPFFLSNLIANTIGYFLNRSKTFRSDAPWWHYVLYLIVLFLLIVFSTWLQGVIVNGLIQVGWEGPAPTIAAMAAGGLQFLALFPLQKFVFLREKKVELQE